MDKLLGLTIFHYLKFPQSNSFVMPQLSVSGVLLATVEEKMKCRLS